MNCLRTAAIATSLSLLSSCSGFFVPSYNGAIYGKIEAANSSLAKIETVVATRAPVRVSYKDVEPYYVEALAGVTEAGEIAKGRSDYFHGKPAAGTAQSLADNIGRCRDAIESSRRHFQSAGQSRNEADNLSILRNVCGIPNTMQNALK